MIPQLPPAAPIVRNEPMYVRRPGFVEYIGPSPRMCNCGERHMPLDACPLYGKPMFGQSSDLSALSRDMEPMNVAIKGVIFGRPISTHIFARGPGGKTRQYSTKTWHIRQKAVRRELRRFPVITLALEGIA